MNGFKRDRRAFQWASAIFVCTNLVVAATVAAQPVKVTAQNLRELVEQGSPSLKSQNLQAQAADELRGSLGRSFLPVIEASVGGETFTKGRERLKTQPEYGIEARMNLFNSGRDKITAAINDAQADLQKIELRRTKAEVLSEAGSLYWESLYLREWILSLKQAQTLNQTSLASADRRIRSGVATQIDRLEFEMQGAELARALRQAELDFEIRRDRLALVLGINGSIELTDQMQHTHEFEKAISHADEEMRYWTEGLNLQAQSAGLESQKLGRSWLPRLEAYAGYHQLTEREEDFADAADRTESYAGLKIVMNLSAGLEEQREARAKQLQAQALKAQYERQQKEMRLHMTSEIKELKRLHDQVHDFEENIQRADRYLKLTQSEYSRGVRNSPDVLGANLKLLEAREKRLKSIRDFQIAKSHLMAKLGRP